MRRTRSLRWASPARRLDWLTDRSTPVTQPANHSRIGAHAAPTLYFVSDYEWQVQLAAKGMAERDNRPMPESVTTPEEFYQIMAAAALDAIGFRALVERVARAERNLEMTFDALREADAKAESARHRKMTDEADSSESSIASILRGASTTHGPERIRTHHPLASPLPTDPERRDTVGKPRRLSAVPPPVNRSAGTRPFAQSRQSSNRTAQGSPRVMAKLRALVARRRTGVTA